MSGLPFRTLAEHVSSLRDALDDLAGQSLRMEAWAEDLARLFEEGGRLLAAGNGGSAAAAQHLTAELVGRFEDPYRRPLSALALHVETSSLTAMVNDFGGDEMFARQVEAHGRAGDVLMLLSSSGRSANLLSAAHRAHRLGIRVWALTGPEPNPLAALAERAICAQAHAGTAVQEVHLVVVHALCAALERRLASRSDLHTLPRHRPRPGRGRASRRGGIGPLPVVSSPCPRLTSELPPPRI